MTRAALALLLIALAGPASAQIIQNFEDNPQRDPFLYEQCFEGDRIRADSQGVIQGQQQLSAGPLNSGQTSFYQTPFLSVTAAGTFSFKHMAENAGSQSLPSIFVELIDPNGQVAAELFEFEYSTVGQVVSTPLAFGRDGVYRVRWRFEGGSGNDRVALDAIVLNATASSSPSPACGPIIPTNLPPVATPDAATTPAGRPVVTNVLVNDFDPDGVLEPATVNLQPDSVSSIVSSRDIRNASGVLIGTATVDATGNVTVTPVAGYVGPIVVPYSVRDTLGAVSNSTDLVVTVQGATADLSLSLGGSLVVVSGDQAIYGAILQNSGPDTIGAATVTFTVTGPIASLGAACGVGRSSCAPAGLAGQIVTVPVQALAVGSFAIVSLTGTTTGPGTVTVEASVAPDAPAQDPNPSNNSGQVMTDVRPLITGADLMVSMTGPAENVPGQLAAYTIAVTNNGPDPATGVVVSTTGPPGFTLVNVSGPCPTPQSCPLGTLNPGDVRSFTAQYVRLLPPGPVLRVPPANDIVTVTSATSDPDPSNNAAGVSTRIITDVDVVIGSSPPLVPTAVGETFSLVVTAGNNGRIPAREFVVALSAPPGLVVDSFTPTVGTFDPGTGIWQIPEVRPGLQQELRLLLRSTVAGVLPVTATATHPPTDTNASNDVDQSQIIVVPSADVATRITLATTDPVVGVPFTLNVHAGNLGPSRSQPVSVRLILPPGVRFVSAAPPVGAFNPGTSIWTVGPLESGAILTMPVVVVTDVSFPYLVIVRASAAGFDPNLPNNAHYVLLNVASSADVKLTLTTDNPNPVDGETVTIRAVVTNAGPSTALGTVVNFAAPAGGITPVSVTPSPGTTVTASAQWIIGALSPHAIVTLDAVLQIGEVGALPLSATVSSSTLDPNPANNTAEVMFHAGSPDYDVGVAVAAATEVPIGITTVVTVAVRNVGPAAASGVEATVTLPPGLQFRNVITPLALFEPATGVWTIGPLAANETALLKLGVDVTAAGPHPVEVAMTAGLDFDVNPANNQASAIVTGLPAADVALLQTVTNDAPVQGETITFTLTATNLGPSPAGGLTASTSLPSGLTLQTTTPSAGAFDPATGVWTIGALAPGAQATLVQTVLVGRTGTFQTTAVISDVNEFDPNHANNSTGVALNAGVSSDVGIDIAIAPDTVLLGDQVRILVNVQNAGPSESTDVVVHGSIPTGLNAMSLTPSVGTVDGAGRWTVGALAAGTTGTLEIVAEVTATGTISGSANVTHANPDPNPVNDEATGTLNAGARTDVRVTVFPGAPQTVVSTIATMYVVVTNEGPSDASAVDVDITLAPAPGMQLVTTLASAGSFDAATRRWTVGPVAAGARKVLTLFTLIGDAGLLPIAAQVVTPGAGGDPNIGNDQGVGIIEVLDSTRTVADMQMVMSGPGSIAPGADATFFAQAFNAGSTYAVDLTIDVTVPAGLQVVSVTPTFGGVCPTPGAGGVVQCVWPGQSVVGSGRLRRITMVLRADSGAVAGTRLAIEGRVTSLTPDPYPANDAARMETVVGGGSLPDVALAKILVPSGVGEGSALLGTVITYRLTVQNLSAVAAPAVTVTDTLAPMLAPIAVRPSQGSIDTTSGAWVVGALASGAIATLDVDARVVAPGRAVLPAVQVVGLPGDGNAANDRAAITLDVPVAVGGSRFVAAGNVDAIGEKEIIAGTGIGEPGQVRIFDGQGRPRTSFYAYDPRFLGGVRVASCDLDGDGRDEIITGAGYPNGGPHVRIFQAFSGDRVVEVNSFYSDGEPYRGGIYVACGDVTGDGRPEVITGTGTIGPATIRVWEVGLFTFTEIATWQAFPTPEARVATCDLNGDGRTEVLATSGPGTPATIGAFDGAGGFIGGLPVLGGFPGGAFVACGDFSSASGGPEVVVSADAGGPPLLEVYSSSGALVGSLLADDPAARGGVRVAVGDVDGAAAGEELIVGSGLGRLPVVRLGSAASGPLVELRSLAVPNLP